ncbi:MAG: formate dehydrogenase subunit alpha [Chloroflexi bacterium]|nr:formate dehydrogenase subunit alpha [Chloroflexota bacterium]
MSEITINGRIVATSPGKTILEVARDAGITIPTLCYHKDLTPYGGCQLCLVEVQGERRSVQACTYEARPGLVVQTETAFLIKGRRELLKMILSNYFDSGYCAADEHRNELLEWAAFYDLQVEDYSLKAAKYPVDSDPNPFILVDFNKCIVCTRCVRACAQVQGRFVWGITDRGFDARPAAGMDQPLLEARCESCGACVAYCPTGALSNKMAIDLGKVEKRVRTTCTYCGVGCQVTLNVGKNRILSVSSSPDAPVNGMRLCVKGRYGYDFVHHSDRLTSPMVRSYLLEGKERLPRGERGVWVKVDWDTALTLAARKLLEIRKEFGAKSIGVLSSAKCTNEENYLMNKFARQVIGTNNIDHCARLCHSSTVVGLAASFGSGAMTNSMDDIAEQAGLIFVTGSNTTEQHPVFGSMLRQAVLKRGATLIVADPRKIDLTEFASLHLQMKSGTDIALINGLMNIILENGWEDRNFVKDRTEGFEAFSENLKIYTPEWVSELTGISLEKLFLAAKMLGTIKPGAVIWAMGITQHTVGVQNVQTLANLQMLLGNIGKPGSGVNPLRGQNNVQGACDMGALPNVYPAYQSVLQETSRKKFEEAWGVDLDPKIGLAVTEMIPGAESGEIQALYILGEDPMTSEPDSNHVRHCLQELNFLVLQEIFPTETSKYADILLPGVSFAEKAGTFTNTERRVQLVNPAIDPIGDARQDWQITSDLASRMFEMGDRKPKLSATFSSWAYSGPSQVMEEIAALAPSYAGASHQRLSKGERLQWPIKGLDHPGTPILHTSEFTRGKGNFAVTTHIPPVELPDAEYPFLLNTGRVLYHWHGGAITRRAKGLNAVYPHSLIEINPEDAARLLITEDHQPVRVFSKRGEIHAFAWITDRVPEGMIYSNFHFSESPTNELTINALDPVAKIPEFKICAVRLEKD